MEKRDKSAIWFVNTCGSRNIGGVETARAQWSKALIERRYPVVWWCPSDQEKQILDQNNPLPEGIDNRLIDNVPFPVVRRFPTPQSTATFLYSALREKPDKIVFNGQSDLFLPLMAGLIYLGQAKKVVQIFHGDPRPDRNVLQYRSLRQTMKYNLRPLRDFTTRGLYSNPDITTIAVSQFVAQRIKDLKLASSVKVYYPPTLDETGCYPRIKQNETKPLKVLTVSRISPEKGLDLLVKIAKACAEQNVSAEFTLVGSINQPASYSYLNRLKADMGHNIALTGPKVGADLCNAYNNADLFLMPSQNEGLGLVTIEALKHGTPVIARNIPTSREIFVDGTFSPGLLVNPHDDTSAVRQAIQHLNQIAANRPRLSQLSDAAFKTACRFEPRRLTDNFISGVLIQ